MKEISTFVFSSMVGVALLASAVFAGSLLAQERQEEQRLLFIAENEDGKVWANLTLTIQRTTEPYLPMVVAVENQTEKPATFNRESFWLNDLDDIIYTLPTVKELRKSYDKAVMDYRMVSYAGIPWENWRWNRRLEMSNFFPDLRASRGTTVRDQITLRQRHAMVDLLYFERPRNLGRGRPIFLNVRGKNWEIPIRIRLVFQ
jgi:hypothetical protein